MPSTTFPDDFETHYREAMDGNSSWDDMTEAEKASRMQADWDALLETGSMMTGRACLGGCI